MGGMDGCDWAVAGRGVAPGQPGARPAVATISAQAPVAPHQVPLRVHLDSVCAPFSFLLRAGASARADGADGATGTDGRRGDAGLASAGWLVARPITCSYSLCSRALTVAMRGLQVANRPAPHAMPQQQAAPAAPPVPGSVAMSAPMQQHAGMATSGGVPMAHRPAVPAQVAAKPPVVSQTAGRGQAPPQAPAQQHHPYPPQQPQPPPPQQQQPQQPQPPQQQQPQPPKANQ